MGKLRDVLTRIVTGESPGGEEGTPEDKLSYWVAEFQSADRFVEKWHTAGNKTIDAYLGEKEEDATFPKSRLNLFYSNITTLQAMLYAKMPKVEADRRFVDPNDDVGRVAAEIMTRCLQNEMYDPDDTFGSASKQALSDRLLPGLGCVRIKYDMTESAEVPAVEGVSEAVPAAKTEEWCDFIYTSWNDVRWSPCRTASELRWKAYRSYMTKPEAASRFGEEVAAGLAFSSKGPDYKNGSDGKATQEVERKQAEIWEIWDKSDRKVYWYAKGYFKLLDEKDDPLGLPEFFPDEFDLANTTTRKYLPKPDYALAQDLYEEIDSLETRISLLTDAAKCIGVYDQSAKEVARIFQEGVENQLIPVPNWAVFGDKGGLKGTIDWLPIEPIVNAIETLVQQQKLRIEQLYEVTGMSDILRGQSNPNETLGAQKIKAQFGSSRIQAIQEDFAYFVECLLNKKAFIISKFYDPQRIVDLSNIMNTPDARLAEQAVALIKDQTKFKHRVVIRADSMAQVDMDRIKAERTEYLQATAQFIGQSLPMIQANPTTAPYLLQLMKFGLSAFGASNEVEGVIDQFVAAIEDQIKQAAAQPPKPSPEQEKLQGQMQLAQMKQQAEMQSKQAEAALDAQKMQAELAMDQQRFQLEVKKMEQELMFQQQEHQLKMMELEAKIQAQRETQALKAQGAQQDAAIKAQSAEMDAGIRENEAAQTAEIRESEAAQNAEIQKRQAEATPRDKD